MKISYGRTVVVCGLESHTSYELRTAANSFLPLEELLGLKVGQPLKRIDFSMYDWAPFIQLVDRLERDMPLVGPLIGGHYTRELWRGQRRRANSSHAPHATRRVTSTYARAKKFSAGCPRRCGYLVHSWFGRARCAAPRARVPRRAPWQ